MENPDNTNSAAEPAEAPTPPPPAPPPPPPPAWSEPPRSTSQQKSPLLAGFLSALPGLGNVYNGLYLRGFTFFVIWVALFAMVNEGPRGAEAVLIPSMIFFWIFNAFDAYRQATFINYGYTAEPARPDVTRWHGGGGILAGVVLVLIGLYGILEQFFDIDLSWVIDQWPWPVMAFGVWLIYKSWKQGREDSGGLGESEI